MTAHLRAVVVMGVSGAGKSRIGSAVADQLQWPFIDADDLHPVANKTKMALGQPIDDTDRWPWLDIVVRTAAAGEAVVACSALRRIYRDRLLAGLPGAVFVELEVSHIELERRAHIPPGSGAEVADDHRGPPGGGDRSALLRRDSAEFRAGSGMTGGWLAVLDRRLLGFAVGESVGLGAGFDDSAVVGEPVDDGRRTDWGGGSADTSACRTVRRCTP